MSQYLIQSASVILGKKFRLSPNHNKAALTSISDFDFNLPEELVALYPSADRSASRLLYVPIVGTPQHCTFKDITQFLRPNDLLVLNDSKVLRARLYARKPSGGKVEILVERVLGSQRMLVQLKSSKSIDVGSELHLGTVHCKVEERKNDLFEVSIARPQDVASILEDYGQVPLPPYIKRAAKEIDEERYQTVYARHLGSVAAPTAGLHFDHTLLSAIEDLGVKYVTLTLHVGAGTFQPIRTPSIENHQMHQERIHIDQTLAESIARCQDAGGRVIAVGSTVLRALESVIDAYGNINPFEGETDIFIRPGYQFKIVDVLITNFHVPRSSLLVLVCAFAGRQKILAAYQNAIEHKYRFYSYGDAMWLECANIVDKTR